MDETETAERNERGALEELAGDPSSRKRFLKAVGGSGAASAFALFLAACGSKKTGNTPGGSNPNTAAGSGTDQFGAGDLGIARFLITLEHFESDFYAAVGKSGKLGGKARTLAQRFGQQENQHVNALAGAIGKLGGKPPAPPKPQTFKLASQPQILGLALSLENLAAGTLLGQVDRIKSKTLLATVLSIHSVEGRHAAAFASLLGQDPAPDGPFARPVFGSDTFSQLHTLISTG